MHAGMPGTRVGSLPRFGVGAAAPEGQQGPTMPHKPHASGLKCLTAPQLCPKCSTAQLASTLPFIKTKPNIFSPPSWPPKPPHPCPDAHQQTGFLHFFICASPIPIVITVLWQPLRNFNSETISVTIPGFDSLPQTPLPLPASSRSRFAVKSCR